MAAGIGNISIGFVADTSKFMAGAAKVDAKLKSLGAGSGAFTGILSKVNTPIAAAGTAIAILGAEVAVATSFLHGMIEEVHNIDDISDAAKNIGTTTNGLIHLRFAAERAGSSAEEMDNSLKKMVRTVGEARGGSKEAVAAFAKIGLSADKLSKQDPEQTFKDIAQGFKNIKNPADRAAAAVGIFGRGGQSMLGTLDLGESGLSKMAAAADRLGLSISEIDAEKVGKLDDSFKNLEASITAIFRRAVVTNADKLQKGTNIALGATDFVAQHFNDVASLSVPAYAATQVPRGVSPLMDAVAIGILEPLEKRGKELNDMAGGAADGLDKVTDSLESLLQTVKPAAMEFSTATFSKLSQMEAAVNGGTIMEQLGQKQNDLLKKIETNTRPSNVRSPEVRL